MHYRRREKKLYTRNSKADNQRILPWKKVMHRLSLIGLEQFVSAVLLHLWRTCYDFEEAEKPPNAKTTSYWDHVNANPFLTSNEIQREMEAEFDCRLLSRTVRCRLLKNNPRWWFAKKMPLSSQKSANSDCNSRNNTRTNRSHSGRTCCGATNPNVIGVAQMERHITVVHQTKN